MGMCKCMGKSHKIINYMKNEALFINLPGEEVCNTIKNWEINGRNSS